MQDVSNPTTQESPSSTTNEQLMSPSTRDPATDVDPLVAQTAKKLADVINDFKRELDKRDGTWARAHGTFLISLKADQSATYELVMLPDEDGDEYPVTVRAQHKEAKDAADGQILDGKNPITPLITSNSTYAATRRASDAELEQDIVSRKKRKLDEGDGGPRKRTRPDEDDDDIMPLITKEDLDSLLSQLREDIQEDTSECVNHVQKLLRRFKEEWHEHTATVARQPPRSLFGDSVIGNSSTPAVGAFPSPTLDKDDQNVSIPDLIRKEVGLLSSQIHWVEECRRVAADVHDKREENWRTSSAGFHDRARQDREGFQTRMLYESTEQGRLLNQILNEVRAIGLYSQSMKWETPGHLAPYPPVPPQPAFPTQPPLPLPPLGQRKGHGGANK